MKNVVFDGVAYAAKLSSGLAGQAQAIAWRRGRKLKLVSILNPDFRASVVYSGIKARKAAELGVDFEKVEVLNYRFKAKAKPRVTDVAGVVERLNADESVDGIMIQLPLSGERDEDKRLCDLIAPQKDVDGLGEKSKYKPAAVLAVFAVLEQALQDQKLNIKDQKLRVAVVGSLGTVGAALVRQFAICNLQFAIEAMDRPEFDPDKLKEADVVISCTGQAGLITGDMVKTGVIAIDVGWPRGDFEFASVVPKASFITPVPGGVGPVTVVKLFENLCLGK